MIVLIIILSIILLGGFIAFFIIKDKKEKEKKKLEEEAKKKAEEEARKKAEEEAKKKAEEEAKKKAEEEARKKAEEEAKKKAEEEYINKFEGYLNKFKSNLPKDNETYIYFKKLYDEAFNQYYNKTSLNNIPKLVSEDNFPHLYKFGNIKDTNKAFDTLIGWLFALQLSELKPFERINILKNGYELGGYTKYDNIYGYEFESDPNIMRQIAATIYATMRGLHNPNIDLMRKEINGQKFNKTLYKLGDEKRDNIDSQSSLYTDFREFMPTAPGPYSPSYSIRPDRTYPNEERDEYDNLKVDRDIHEYIVENYNLDNENLKQEVVQAIADKEADKGHMFGSNRNTANYSFHPIFGLDTIGIELKEDGDIAELVKILFNVGSSSRGILQSASVNPKQYGRLRPGCSWSKESTKNSSKDNRRNILTNFEIEDGDGSPTGYYDKKGNWVYKDAIDSPQAFEESQRKLLYANSYPSGHSSGIFSASMILMELMPFKADRILKEANQYAVNRTIARYHWTSDTRNGRVLGSATNAVAHAANDFNEFLQKAKNELNS